MVLLARGELIVEPGNLTAVPLLRSQFAQNAEDLLAGDSAPLRLELLGHKRSGADGTHGFSVLQLNPRGAASERIADGVASLFRMQPPLSLVTVFPERARWRPGPMAPPEKDAQVSYGETELLSEWRQMEVAPAEALSFEHAWREFGYNSLGEEGVVRCDLLREEARPHVYWARKLFHGEHSRLAHEASTHRAAWAQRVQPMLSASHETELQDAIYPQTFAFPFRSRW